MSEPLINSPVKHWCEFEFISKTVKNPNIHIKGNYSYYSAYWDQGFERCVVRYLHDKPSTTDKPIDQLYIGNFVCFGAECVIMMGGNQLHRTDWISAFPFDTRSFVPAGNTIIGDGCWIGSRAMIMQGVEPNGQPPRIQVALATGKLVLPEQGCLGQGGCEAKPD